MTDLAFLPLSDASALIRARKLSPVDYTRALLDRIAALDPATNAFLAVTADLALAQARQAETEIAKGEWRGPMHGVPYAAKDLFDIEGMATICHSKLRMNHRAASDAFVVRRLREAGAVLLGKLALHEFAAGGPACAACASRRCRSGPTSTAPSTRRNLTPSTSALICRSGRRRD